MGWPRPSSKPSTTRRTATAASGRSPSTAAPRTSFGCSRSSGRTSSRFPTTPTRTTTRTSSTTRAAYATRSMRPTAWSRLRGRTACLPARCWPCRRSTTATARTMNRARAIRPLPPPPIARRTTPACNSAQAATWRATTWRPASTVGGSTTATALPCVSPMRVTPTSAKRRRQAAVWSRSSSPTTTSRAST